MIQVKRNETGEANDVLLEGELGELLTEFRSAAKELRGMMDSVCESESERMLALAAMQGMLEMESRKCLAAIYETIDRLGPAIDKADEEMSKDPGKIEEMEEALEKRMKKEDE